MESQEKSSCSNSNFSKLNNKSPSGGWSDDDDFFGGGQEESGVMVPTQARSEGILFSTT